jgi:hypothetical protein
MVDIGSHKMSVLLLFVYTALYFYLFFFHCSVDLNRMLVCCERRSIICNVKNLNTILQFLLEGEVFRNKHLNVGFRNWNISLTLLLYLHLKGNRFIKLNNNKGHQKFLSGQLAYKFFFTEMRLEGNKTTLTIDHIFPLRSSFSHQKQVRKSSFLKKASFTLRFTLISYFCGVIFVSNNCLCFSNCINSDSTYSTFSPQLHLHISLKF